MNALSMSLDDIIKDKRTSLKKNHIKGSKPNPKAIKSNNFKKPGKKLSISTEMKFIQKPPVKFVVKRESKPSIFQRLGNVKNNYLVEFHNLNDTVGSEDLIELCSTVGKVVDSKIIFDSNGKGLGKVYFSSAQDASKCVESFNGMTLDDQVMLVKLGDKASISQFKSETKKNVREGLFGTAIQNSSRRNAPTFAITLDGGSKGRRPGRNVVHNKQNDRKKGSFQRKEKFNGQRNDSNTKMEDLDADLDSYMSSRNN